MDIQVRRDIFENDILKDLNMYVFITGGSVNTIPINPMAAAAVPSPAFEALPNSSPTNPNTIAMSPYPGNHSITTPAFTPLASPVQHIRHGAVSPAPLST